MVPRSAVSQISPLRGEISAFAIDAHRGGDDQAADTSFEERLHQRRRALLVDRRVPFDFIHALADPDYGRQDAVRSRRCAARGESAAPFLTSPKM